MVELGVRIKSRSVGKGKFLGFCKEVNVIGTAGAHGGNIILFERIENLKCGDSLTVRR